MIQTERLSTAVMKCLKYLVKQKQERIITKFKVNQNKDWIITTDKNTYYFKLQREPKFIEEFGEPKGTKSLTINEPLVWKHTFEYLIIYLELEKKLYITHKDNVLDAIQKGRVRITNLQKEKVVNIKMDMFEAL